MNLIPPCLVLSQFTLGLSSLQAMAKTPCFSEYNPSKMSANQRGLTTTLVSSPLLMLYMIPVYFGKMHISQEAQTSSKPFWF